MSKVEQGLLGSLLSLVTKPDMVQKNIELLQKHMVEHDRSLQAAIEAHAAADNRHAAAAKRETDLLLREKEAVNKEDVLDGQRKNLEGNLAQLLSSQQSFNDQKAAHAKAVAEFALTKKALEADIEQQKKDVQARLAEAGRQKAALDVREAAVAAREEEASKTHANLKDRLQKMKQLAS